MKTLGEVLKLSTAFLEERNVMPARRMAEELLAHALRLKRLDLYMQFDRPVEEKELALVREFLKRMAKGEPLEYITGEVMFSGCKIKVDSRCFIPRPETELLVEIIAKRIRGTVLWDVCTGSGYLGIAIKKAMPHLAVALSDLSGEVLDLARENARENGAEVELFQGDLLAPFAGRKADVIVCNPPYISEKEYGELDACVRDFEPKRALLGGERGTEFYERLAEESLPYLTGRGQLFLEIGAGQGESVKKIFSGKFWDQKELIRDWAGKDRFFFLEKQ